MRLKKIKKGKSLRIKSDLGKLKDPNIAAEFQATIGGKFAPLLTAQLDIDRLNSQLNVQFVDTAEEVLGSHRGRQQTWMSNEVLEICDGEMKKKRFSSKADQDSHRQINRKVKKATKMAKEK